MKLLCVDCILKPQCKELCTNIINSFKTFSWDRIIKNCLNCGCKTINKERDNYYCEKCNIIYRTFISSLIIEFKKNNGIGVQLATRRIGFVKKNVIWTFSSSPIEIN